MKYVEKALKVIEEVEKVIIGKNQCIEKIMEAILAEGHILIEDIPGVGKTSMALAFAKAMDLEQNRVQFTPDVLPTDILGFSMYQKDLGSFQYQPGAVMCNLFLGDEINRTSPKTQSALLEVMEEGTVTIDGVTREIPKPFHVIATENPIGSVGTQMLPESQLDRFMICIQIGYPDAADELKILMDRHTKNPMEDLKPVIRREELILMQKEVEKVYIHPVIYQYIIALANESRSHEMVELGISPRGSLALSKMAKAVAYLKERDYVTPNDVESVFMDVGLHRICLNAKGKLNHMAGKDVIEDILMKVTKPKPEKMQ